MVGVGEWFDQVGRPDCGGVERMMGGWCGFWWGWVGLRRAATGRGRGWFLVEKKEGDENEIGKK